jgi:hypothetical protein
MLRRVPAQTPPPVSLAVEDDRGGDVQDGLGPGRQLDGYVVEVYWEPGSPGSGAPRTYE